MSTINVTNLSGRGGGTPNLPDGAVISGVATITNLKPTNVNVSGAVTATTFDGSLKSTGTPTLGLGVTINSSGLHISGVTTVGVVTGGTYYGSGSNLTGVGESIAPWHYNPDINDITVDVDTGIGVTFNKKIESGSGTATLKIVNAGAAGTTIQSWGVSSATYNVTQFTLDALVSNLTINQTYQLDIPSGFVVDSNETSYAGTAYTFTVQPADQKLWVWGRNDSGELGQSSRADYSSPVQIPGGIWGNFVGDGAGSAGPFMGNIKTDGTLWMWGANQVGELGQGGTGSVSSPIQVGTDTTWSKRAQGDYHSLAIKTDGTLWSWGYNTRGQVGDNSRTNVSSPKQIPGTTWSDVFAGVNVSGAIKTDGTLWAWGTNHDGQLGLNNRTQYSSPVQIPGTTWRTASQGGTGSNATLATKTDGTLWGWGNNQNGTLGVNDTADRSSPTQIPGTSWSSAVESMRRGVLATRTDGTLWAWGYGAYGQLGINDRENYSSPVQLPGTTWGTNQNTLKSGAYFGLAAKTDGTLWAWGENSHAMLGQNNKTQYSSPVQIPGTDWTSVMASGTMGCAIEKDTTP